MGLSKEQERNLADFIARTMEKHDVPGLSVAVMREGELVYARGFGHRDAALNLPAEPDTVYGIGSVTKSFTAQAVMLLAEGGHLSVGDPVRRYLPEFQFADAQFSDTITLHHFLTHTSGLPPGPALKYALRESLDPGDIRQLEERGMWEEIRRAPPIDDAEQLMSFLAEYEEPPLGRPGEVFSYSNDAYALLGAIVERVSGRSYEEFIRAHIADEVGMEQVHFRPDEVAGCDRATELYTNESEAAPGAHAGGWLHAPAMLGAGFLKTSVLDLIRYGCSYLRGNPLSPGGVSMMSSPFFPAGRDTHYGYGLMVHPGYHGLTVVEHGGSIKGVSAQFGFVPKRDLTAAVLTNVQNVPAQKVWRGAVNAALGIPLEERWGREPEYSCPPEYLVRYEGKFRSGEGAELTVAAEDGQLYAWEAGERKRLRLSGIDTAAIRRRGEETGLRFMFGPAGQLEALHYGLRVLRRVRP